MTTIDRPDGAVVREIPPDSTIAAYPAMRELRPHVDDPDEFVRRVDEVQRPHGYRLVGVFLDGHDDAASVAGFRTGDNLAVGSYMYVDDLVTVSPQRGRGHGRLLMKWLVEEARRLRCEHFHLDSAPHRHSAHRLYLTAGMDITSFHFGLNLLAPDAD